MRYFRYAVRERWVTVPGSNLARKRALFENIASGAMFAFNRSMTMSFDRSLKQSQRALNATAVKLGLKKLRNEFAGLDRLDRAELDDDDVCAPSESLRVA